MSKIRLAYDANDYIRTKVRVLYIISGGVRVYDFQEEKEADVLLEGVVGDYSRISGHEYVITVHRNFITYI